MLEKKKKRMEKKMKKKERERKNKKETKTERETRRGISPTCGTNCMQTMRLLNHVLAVLCTHV